MIKDSEAAWDEFVLSEANRIRKTSVMGKNDTMVNLLMDVRTDVSALHDQLLPKLAGDETAVGVAPSEMPDSTTDDPLGDFMGQGAGNQGAVPGGMPSEQGGAPDASAGTGLEGAVSEGVSMPEDDKDKDMPPMADDEEETPAPEAEETADEPASEAPDADMTEPENEPMGDEADEDAVDIDLDEDVEEDIGDDVEAPETGGADAGYDDFMALLIDAMHQAVDNGDFDMVSRLAQAQESFKGLWESELRPLLDQIYGGGGIAEPIEATADDIGMIDDTTLKSADETCIQHLTNRVAEEKETPIDQISDPSAPQGDAPKGKTPIDGITQSEGTTHPINKTADIHGDGLFESDVTEYERIGKSIPSFKETMSRLQKSYEDSNYSYEDIEKSDGEPEDIEKAVDDDIGTHDMKIVQKSGTGLERIHAVEKASDMPLDDAENLEASACEKSASEMPTNAGDATDSQAQPAVPVAKHMKTFREAMAESHVDGHWSDIRKSSVDVTREASMGTAYMSGDAGIAKSAEDGHVKFSLENARVAIESRWSEYDRMTTNRGRL